MRLQRLRDLRENHHDTQGKITSLLYVGQNTYLAYERGKINSPLEALIILADYYSTSIDYPVERTNRRAFEAD